MLFRRCTLARGRGRLRRWIGSPAATVGVFEVPFLLWRVVTSERWLVDVDVDVVVELPCLRSRQTGWRGYFERGALDSDEHLSGRGVEMDSDRYSV